MDQFINFFALTIYKSKINLKENERNELIDEIISQKKKSDNTNYISENHQIYLCYYNLRLNH